MRGIYALGMVLLMAFSCFGQHYTTIYQIQFDRNPVTGESNWVDSLVTVEGVVSCDFGPMNLRSFCLEMSQAGPWSGIKVYVPSGSFPLEIGDSLRITTSVGEHYDNTELTLSDTNDMVRLGSTNLPPFSIITTAFLDTSATSSLPLDSAEAYECVLIKVVGAFVTDTSDEFGNWEISDGDGYTIVRPNDYYSFTPELGQLVDVAGIVETHYDLYKINPRFDDDIDVIEGVNENPQLNNFGFQLISNPSKTWTTLLLTLPSRSEIEFSVYSVTGSKVAEINKGILGPGDYRYIFDNSELSSGIYFYLLKVNNTSLVRKGLVLK